MRIIGMICIIMGVVMMIVNEVNYKTEKNLANIGSIKINKEETRHIKWPAYTGGVLALAGLGIIFIYSRESK